MSWSDFLQDAGKTVISKWSDKEFTQDYEIERLRLQALGQNGYYNEGQPGTGRVQAPETMLGGVTMSPGLLIGGAVLLVAVLLVAGRK